MEIICNNPSRFSLEYEVSNLIDIYKLYCQNSDKLFFFKSLQFLISCVTTVIFLNLTDNFGRNFMLKISIALSFCTLLLTALMDLLVNIIVVFAIGYGSVISFSLITILLLNESLGKKNFLSLK